MHLSLFAFTLALSVPINAAPVITRASDSTDVKVLQFAGVLEQLETEFYAQALAKFQDSDFTSAGFTEAQVPIQQFENIHSDEATHLSVINSTLESLGASPISACEFDFSSALTNVSTMAATARVVENLGVSAYLGAAHMLSDASLLTAAASIMSVEARHQTILNLLNDATSIPQAFDIALNPSEVLAVASSFISGCDVGFSANTPLTVTNNGPIVQGDTLSFSSTAVNSSTDNLSCQMLVGGAAVSISLELSSCVVPSSINGPVAVFVTSDSQPINSNIREMNTNTIVAGPAMIFVDAQTDYLGELAIAGTVADNSTTSGNSTSSGSGSASAADSTATATAVSSVVVSASTAVSTDVVSATATSASTSSAAATVTSSSASAASASSATSASTITAAEAGSTTETISPEQASSILSAASAASAAAAATGAADVAVEASSTLIIAAPASTSGASTDIVAYPGGPNTYVGPLGAVDVLGWSTT